MDFLFFDDIQKNPHLIPAFIIFSSGAILLLNVYGLQHGITYVLPHLFYLPIILTAYYYPKRGVLFAAGLSVCYCLVSFTVVSPTPAELLSAIARSAVFIVIAGVVSHLSGRMHHDTQMCRRLVSVVKSSNDVIIGETPDGLVSDWNTGAEHVFGYTSDEMVGSPISRLIPPERQEEKHLLMESVLRGETVERFETERITKDGTHIQISLSLSPIFNSAGTVIGVSTIAHDITARKMAEEELKESREMFRNPVEMSPVGVYLLQDGNFVFANPRLAEMFGYSRKEFQSRPMEQYVAEDDWQNVEKIFGPDPLSEDILSGQSEFCGMHRDGTIIRLEEFGSSMIYHGRPARYGTIIDITKRKQAEEQVKESLREKVTLLREIHHRVRNNLQIITSLISLQEHSIPDPVALQGIKEIKTQIGAMALVHELAHSENNPDSINMHDFIHRLAPKTVSEFKDASCKINLTLDVVPVQLSLTQANPCSLILIELLMNSVQHAFPDHREGEIMIRFSVQDGVCKLVYSDDGVGFETHPDSPGAGHEGLLLIHGLTEQLDGTVSVQSMPGTCYTITFPWESRQAPVL